VLEWARELQAYPKATFADHLLFLDFLHQLQDARFSAYLTELEKNATNNSVELAALLSWMSQKNMNLLALDFMKTLPAEITEKWPVPLTIADIYARLKDWRKLESVTKAGNWRQFDFLRYAYLARALRAEDKPAAAEHEWVAATKSAGAQSESLLLLTRVIDDWGWKNEGIDLLWQLAKYPEVQFEALHALYLHYAKTHDSQGLYRVLSRLNEIDPGDLKVQNNLTQVSLLLHVDLERAGKRATDLYRKDPSNPAYASTYAFALYEKGNLNGALSAMSKLRDDQLRDPPIAAYYAIFLAARGDKDKAREYLEQGKQASLLPEEKVLVERSETRLH